MSPKLDEAIRHWFPTTTDINFVFFSTNKFLHNSATRSSDNQLASRIVREYICLKKESVIFYSRPNFRSFGAWKTDGENRRPWNTTPKPQRNLGSALFICKASAFWILGFFVSLTNQPICKQTGRLHFEMKGACCKCVTLSRKETNKNILYPYGRRQNEKTLTSLAGQS